MEEVQLPKMPAQNKSSDFRSKYLGLILVFFLITILFLIASILLLTKGNSQEENNNIPTVTPTEVAENEVTPSPTQSPAPVTEIPVSKGYEKYEDKYISFQKPEGWMVNVDAGENNLEDCSYSNKPAKSGIRKITIYSGTKYSLEAEYICMWDGVEYYSYDPANPLELILGGGGDTTTTYKIPKNPIMKNIPELNKTILVFQNLNIPYLHPSSAVLSSKGPNLPGYTFDPGDITALDTKYVSYLGPIQTIKDYQYFGTVRIKCDVINDQDAQFCADFVAKFFETVKKK